MLYAEDPDIVQRLPKGLAKMTMVAVEACEAFGPTVSREETGNHAILADKGSGHGQCWDQAGGPELVETEGAVYLVGSVPLSTSILLAGTYLLFCPVTTAIQSRVHTYEETTVQKYHATTVV